MKDPRTFFSTGTPAQFEYVFSLYEEAVKLKAQKKNKNVADYLKLDKWFQVELPKRIKSRGKDTHLIHEELVQCMKWKLARGKFSPRIKDLVQMNTPRLCITETKKAFRALLKKDDLSSAIQALCNLKGVGPAMASVILTAADNEQCGFMADECLLAIPEIEGIDYTTKELLNFVERLKSAANRLNGSGGSGWNAHKVEQALWAHFILNENKKELLDDMPSADAAPATENGTDAPAAADHKNGDGESSSDSADSNANKENVTSNGAPRPEDDSNDSLPSATSARPTSDDAVKMLGVQEDTNDSVASSACSSSGSALQSPQQPAKEDEEDENSVNTASPANQMSEDTNDSVVVQPDTALTNGSNGASKADLDSDSSAVASSPAQTPSTLNVNKSQDTAPPNEAEEPAAKKAKLDE
jgi:hypothetical protein